MENSQVERAAVAAVQAHTVPLKVLIDALNVLQAVHELRPSQAMPGRLHVAASIATGSLGHYVEHLLAAHQVGVTA